MTGDDTRERILDVAERLFGEHGYAGTSLRAVTRQAGVNIAAVHYHFGSKDALLRAVLERILAPVNAERIAMLDAAVTRAGTEPVPLAEIVEAFVAPDVRALARMGERGVIVTRFTARSYTEPSDMVQNLVWELFGEVGFRFRDALHAAVPDVPPDEVDFRMSCVVGLLTWLLGDQERMGACAIDPSQTELLLRRLVAIATAALEAPAAGLVPVTVETTRNTRRRTS